MAKTEETISVRIRRTAHKNLKLTGAKFDMTLMDLIDLLSVAKFPLKLKLSK